MCASRLAFIGALLGVAVACSSLSAAGDDPAPAIREVVAAFQRETVDIQAQHEAKLAVITRDAVDRLQSMQDQLCRDARLDEALTIRDQIRRLGAGQPGTFDGQLPGAARGILEAHNKHAAAIQQRCDEEILAAGRRHAEPLQALQDRLCREAKLDEAVLVRDQVRMLLGGIGQALPDPGMLHAQTTDIGKVWYFTVTGNASGSTWGTDVYTSDSHLATTAVHAGAIRVGQKGVVKVTILPGQGNYAGTTRNGVTSSAWGAFQVSFRVDRAYGVYKEAGK